MAPAINFSRAHTRDELIEVVNAWLKDNPANPAVIKPQARAVAQQQAKTKHTGRGRPRPRLLPPFKQLADPRLAASPVPDGKSGGQAR